MREPSGTGFFTPLQNRQYRLLFAGQMLSGFGDWVDFVALMSLVAYGREAGAGGLAAAAAAAAAPWVLVAPVAGVWADRLPQKRTMIACDVLRAALVLCYPLAPSLPVLLALVFAKVSVSTFFAPAQQSALTLIVPKPSLLAANSLSGFASQACKVAGPALGGVLLAVWGTGGAFAVDAATFAASALILSRLALPPRAGRHDRAGATGPGRGRFAGELREGIAFVLGSRALRTAVTGLSATVFLVLAFDTLSPLVLVELGVAPSLYGAAVAAVAVGAVTGTVAVGQWGKRWNAFAVLAVSQTATGVLVALVGAAALTGFRAAAVFWAPVAVGIGLCSTGILVVFLYVVQRSTPQELMGRVTTVVNVVPTMLQISAPLAGAALAAWLGLGWVLACAGLGLAALGAPLLWRRPPAPAADPSDDAGPARPGRPVPSSEQTEKERTVMAFNPIDALTEQGHDFAGATQEQLSVLAELSPQEVEVLNSIKAKLNGEVVGHEAGDGGIVW
ncbi:MFS transporter [Streptomyces klenkii]|uniref:MFS transporter n=1 Tax=Streptomyces klenkii TaxID=1420899 RepID=UPI00341C6BE5